MCISQNKTSRCGNIVLNSGKYGNFSYFINHIIRIYNPFQNNQSRSSQIKDIFYEIWEQGAEEIVNCNVQFNIMMI